MIDKNIQPDYSTKEEKLRLHAALPLLAPAVATAIGAAIGLTGTGLVLQKKIQNYFANNPGALDSIVSKFGTKPGDQPEVEEELKELTKPTTTPIKTWEKSFADTGTKVPEKLPEPKGIEVPPQEKVAPPGFQKAEPLGIDILTKDIDEKTVYRATSKKKQTPDRGTITPQGSDVLGKKYQGRWFLDYKKTAKDIAKKIPIKKDRLILKANLTNKEHNVGKKLWNKFAPNKFGFYGGGKEARRGRLIIPKTAVKNIKVDRKSTREVRKKAMGGLIDKPLTGRSRYI